MTKISTLLTISFLLLGCSNKQEKEYEVYYVIKHPKKITQDTGDAPIQIPVYYGNLNFILLDSSTVYFHSQHVFRYCGTGIDGTKPPRIFLVPDSLTKLSINDLPPFLATSIPDSLASNNRFIVSISSPTDTIKNRAFKVIMDSLKSKNIMRYYIRNWTEEEQFATTAKMENKMYNPDSVDWKVGFDMIFNLPTRQYR